MIKVLIIDDSAVVRMILSQALAADPEIEVVGTAADPFMARDKIEQLDPDVLTLDVEMPRMDGMEFLSRVMASHPLPVIMVSALTQKGKRISLEALEMGAVDVVAKPSGSHGGKGLQEMTIDLRQKIKTAARANLVPFRKLLPTLAPVSHPVRIANLTETTDKVIAIGASTGGTTAIRQILSALPPASPGIVIVQHISSGFSRMFAERLNEITSMEVAEAKDGDRVVTGRVLVAPTGMQMEVVRSGGFYHVKCQPGENVCGHCPSVEVLFRSTAQAVGKNAVGVILTGMGGDGAEGLLALRTSGARTIAQDEESCVVFGMPKVAIEAGGAEFVVPLDRIPQAITKLSTGDR
jgi:two-component system chemotaxis response regulator CheB